jgi:hypothetical protein
MDGYQGETPLDIAAHPTFSKYTPSDWAMLYIERHGQTDGGHHKSWVLDAASRILKGTPVHASVALWANGHQEYRFALGEPSAAYLEWRELMLDRDEHGEPQYAYEEGIPP